MTESNQKLSKEDQEIKHVLEMYLKKLEKGQLSCDEKLNVVEFYIQDKHLKDAEDIRRDMISRMYTYLNSNSSDLEAFYSTFSDYLSYM